MKLAFMKLSPNLRSILLIYLFTLVICLGLRLALWLAYPDFFANITFAEGFHALIVGARFDLAIVTQLSALTLLALVLPFRFASHPYWLKFWMAFAFVPLAVILALGVASIGFFGEVQRHLGAELLFMVNDWPFVIDLLTTSRREEFAGLLLVLGLAGWAWWKLSNFKINSAARARAGSAQIWLTFALALPVLLLLGRGLVLDGKPLNVVDAHALGSAPLGNLAMNAAFSIIHTSRNLDETLRSPISDLEAERLRDKLGIHQPNPFLRQYGRANAQAPNIVMIILESWSNEYIDGLSGDSLGVTPNMDQLLEQSRVYTNHYAAAQRSIQSLQAILTGVPVLPGQPRLSEGLEQVDMTRIGQMAADQGYGSVFVQSSSRRSFRMDSVAASLGFSEYYGQEDIPLLMDYPQSTPRFGWDHETLQFFGNQIDRLASTRPVLGVVFTGTTHEPFADPGARFHRYPHDAGGETGYLNTLAYSDWALGEFFAQARKSEWFQNTYFVITSDHVLRASAESLRSRFHVPLIIHAPEHLQPARTNKLVSHYDILPTLVDLMGSHQPFVAFGESVFRDELPDEAWVNQGEMIGLLRSDAELSFSPSQLGPNRAADKTRAQESLWLRATLLTHIAIEKLNLNRWMLGARQ